MNPQGRKVWSSFLVSSEHLVSQLGWVLGPGVGRLSVQAAPWF